MASDMRVDGRITCALGKVLKRGLLGTSTKENIRTTNKKAMGHTRTLTEAITKVNGKMDKCTGMELTLLRAGTIMKASGKEVSDMAKVRDIMQRQESSQKENGLTISSLLLQYHSRSLNDYMLT